MMMSDPFLTLERQCVAWAAPHRNKAVAASVTNIAVLLDMIEVSFEDYFSNFIFHSTVFVADGTMRTVAISF